MACLQGNPAFLILSWTLGNIGLNLLRSAQVNSHYQRLQRKRVDRGAWLSDRAGFIITRSLNIFFLEIENKIVLAFLHFSTQ